MFSAATSERQFEQIRRGDAATQELEGVTGGKLGTSKLFKFKTLSDPKVETKPSDFTVQPPQKPPREKMGNVLLPPGSNPPPPMADTSNLQAADSIADRWHKHQNTRRDMLLAGKSSQEVDAAGYQALTYDEFKAQESKMHPKSPEQLATEEENKGKRLAALRLAKNVSAYHNQGSFANRDGFNVGKTPSILKIPTDGLSSRLFMFSPEWQKMQGVSKLSDDELLLEIDQTDLAARERVRRAKEQERKKRQEEERRRRREQ